MLANRLKIWFLSLFTLALIPSTFAAEFDFTQPFSLIFSLFNSIFVAAEPYVGQTGFQRFMYWILIFTIVFFSGQKLPLGEDNQKKKIAGIFAALLATAGAFAANPQVITALGQVVGIIIPWGFAVGALFYWVFRPNFMETRPRIKHIIRFCVYMLTIAAVSYLTYILPNMISANPVGNMAFQLAMMFLSILLVYELIMIFVDGVRATAGVVTDTARAVTQDVNNLIGGLPGAASGIRQAGNNIRDAWNTLTGTQRPNHIAEYTAFPTDIIAFNTEIANMFGVVTQLRNLETNLVAPGSALRGDPRFIAAVRAQAGNMRIHLTAANRLLTTITGNPGVPYLTPAQQNEIANAVANFTLHNNQFLVLYTWLQGHMY